MKKSLMKLEIGGIFFIIAVSVFMQNLYSLCAGDAIGVIFGSVNQSIWETLKTLLLPYVLWGFIELLSLHLPLRRFTSAKVISLCYLGLSYLIIFTGIRLLNLEGEYILCFVFAVFCTCTSLYLSYRLMYSVLNLENLFYPAFFVLLLFAAFFFSFTPFPPHIFIFEDKLTGLYGIIPKNLDTGAIILDTLYYL